MNKKNEKEEAPLGYDDLEIESLNISRLDVSELERRIELATGMPMVDDIFGVWCDCNGHSCGCNGTNNCGTNCNDCTTFCGSNCYTDCVANCATLSVEL